MPQERIKLKNPSGGNEGSGLELQDLRDQVPDIDNILAEVDLAISKSDSLLARGYDPTQAAREKLIRGLVVNRCGC